EGPLRVGAYGGRLVVERLPDHLDRRRVALPRLEGEDALADGRDQLQTLGDGLFVAEPDQARGGEHDGVVLPGGELAEARVDVAAQRRDAEIAPLRAQLGDAPNRRGADVRARGQGRERQPIAGAEDVARVL